MSTQSSTSDASFELKIVDGIVYVNAKADLVQMVQDMINKNTSNPLVKIALGMLSTAKSNIDWSGINKEVNI